MDADACPHRLDLLLDVVAAIGGDCQRQAGHDHGGAKVPPVGSTQGNRAPVAVLALGFANDGRRLIMARARGRDEAGRPALRIAGWSSSGASISRSL